MAALYVAPRRTIDKAGLPPGKRCHAVWSEGRCALCTGRRLSDVRSAASARTAITRLKPRRRVFADQGAGRSKPGCVGHAQQAVLLWHRDPCLGDRLLRPATQRPRGRPSVSMGAVCALCALRCACWLLCGPSVIADATCGTHATHMKPAEKLSGFAVKGAFALHSSLSPFHSHLFTLTFSLSPFHSHLFTLTFSLSPFHSHPFTLTLSLSPFHSHLFTLTFSLSPFHSHLFTLTF